MTKSVKDSPFSVCLSPASPDDRGIRGIPCPCVTFTHPSFNFTYVAEPVVATGSSVRQKAASKSRLKHVILPPKKQAFRS